MRFSSRHVGYLLAALICLAFGSLLLPGLNRERQEEHLVMAPLDQHAPPELILATTALGGFRGLMLDVIGHRAWDLKVEGKFWELLQLYDWTSKLQPHSEAIWTDISWNMAYNIVAELKDPQARWNWIWRAITLLRDKGLVYNPTSAEIAHELGWLFQQKIGRELDEYYLEYMHRFALKIEKDWGTGLPDLDNMAKLPPTLEGLKQNPKVAELLEAFQAQGIDLAQDFDRVATLMEEGPERGLERLRVEPNEKLADDEQIMSWINEVVPGEAPASVKLDTARKLHLRITEPLEKRFQAPEYAEARRDVRLFRLAQIIRKQYKMEPQHMLEVERNYFFIDTPQGEWIRLDWRLPEPHAMYWADVALRNRLGEAQAGLKEMDTIEAKRLAMFCMRQLYRRGTILHLDPEPSGHIVFGYNLDFLEPARRTFRGLASYYQEHPEERGSLTAKDAEKVLLEEGVRFLYWAGQQTRAERWYKDLNHRYPSDDRDRMTVAGWVVSQLEMMVKEWGRQNQVRTLADTLLVRAYAHLLVNQVTTANMYEAQAKKIWDFYRSDTMMRRQHVKEQYIPTFDELKSMVVEKILGGQYGDMFPEEKIAQLRELLKADEKEEGASGLVGVGQP